jgi:hypothetical protein
MSARLLAYFERFTERTREAVVLAQDEARLFEHPFPTETLLAFEEA